MTVTKRCPTCRRFATYDPDDGFCIACGHDGLEAQCTCGRVYDYAIPEVGGVHCPKCGKPFRGKAPEYDG